MHAPELKIASTVEHKSNFRKSKNRGPVVESPGKKIFVPVKPFVFNGYLKAER